MARKSKKRKIDYKETEFHNFCRERGVIDSPTRKKTFVVTGNEIQLLEPYSLLTRDFRDGKIKLKNVIGRIDLMIKTNSTIYACEIKWLESRSSFWEALKIIGYTAYYNWQNEEHGGFDRAKPAVIIPFTHINLEHKITANKLGVAIFGIHKTRDGYILEFINK